MGKCIEVVREFLTGFKKGIKDRATFAIKNELDDYENIFTLIVMGLFSGMPSPPAGLVLRILPYMQNELKIMSKKTTFLDDMFVQTISRFDID